jgi:NAD-dependent deacetylase
MVEAVCWSCDERSFTQEALERLDAGEDDPRCRTCGGILKTATVMFGQALDPEVLDAAVAAARSCDVLLAVGSTLSVQPAASLCEVAVRSGASLVIVNRDPTGYDGLADRVVRASISDALPALVEELTAL